MITQKLQNAGIVAVNKVANKPILKRLGAVVNRSSDYVGKSLSLGPVLRDTIGFNTSVNPLGKTKAPLTAQTANQKRVEAYVGAYADAFKLTALENFQIGGKMANFANYIGANALRIVDSGSFSVLLYQAVGIFEKAKSASFNIISDMTAAPTLPQLTKMLIERGFGAGTTVLVTAKVFSEMSADIVDKYQKGGNLLVKTDPFNKDYSYIDFEGIKIVKVPTEKESVLITVDSDNNKVYHKIVFIKASGYEYTPINTEKILGADGKSFEIDREKNAVDGFGATTGIVRFGNIIAPTSTFSFKTANVASEVPGLTDVVVADNWEIVDTESNTPVFFGNVEYAL